MKCGVVFRFPDMPVIQQSLILQKISLGCDPFFFDPEISHFLCSMNVSIIGHEFGADLVQVYLGKAKVPGVGVASLGDWMKQQPIVLVDAILKPICEFLLEKLISTSRSTTFCLVY